MDPSSSSFAQQFEAGYCLLCASPPRDATCNDPPVHKVLQNSFASEDSTFLAQVRDVVEKKVKGVEMCELLNASVADRTWYDRWMSQLFQANGVIIIQSQKYLDKMNEGSPLWKEAQAILFKEKDNPEFSVYVLKPGEGNHGPNDLRCWLYDNEQHMNVEGWKKELKKKGCEIDSSTRSRCLAQLLREGSINERSKFDHIATKLEHVNPEDALIVYAFAMNFDSKEVVKKCEKVFKDSFMKLNFEELGKIADHKKVLELFDMNEIYADEDTVYDAIKAYLAHGDKRQLNQTEIDELWSTCRFAFLSPEHLTQLSTAGAQPPLLWLGLGYSRHKIAQQGDSHVESWLAGLESHDVRDKLDRLRPRKHHEDALHEKKGKAKEAETVEEKRIGRIARIAISYLVSVVIALICIPFAVLQVLWHLISLQRGKAYQTVNTKVSFANLIACLFYWSFFYYFGGQLLREFANQFMVRNVPAQSYKEEFNQSYEEE